MKKGFTLLELLVVIAIIGILASVVMVSLGNAKSKAKKANFLSGLDQFTKLMQLEYEAYGSFAGMDSGGWVPGNPTTNTCDLQYGPSSTRVSQFKNQAYNLCNQIVSNSSYNYYPFKVTASSIGYSVQGWLASDSNLYCMGTMGKSLPATGGAVYDNPGCMNNL